MAFVPISVFGSISPSLLVTVFSLALLSRRTDAHVPFASHAGCDVGGAARVSLRIRSDGLWLGYPTWSG